MGGYHDGLFYHPTLLSNVHPSMRLFREHVPGPIAGICSFQSDEEATALAIDTSEGASLSVFSGSERRAMMIGDQLNTAMLHINDQPVNDQWGNTFGGYGSPGNMGGAGVMDWGQFTYWQWVTSKENPPRYPY